MTTDTKKRFKKVVVDDYIWLGGLVFIVLLIFNELFVLVVWSISKLSMLCFFMTLINLATITILSLTSHDNFKKRIVYYEEKK
jgi:hypothetical protein